MTLPSIRGQFTDLLDWQKEMNRNFRKMFGSALTTEEQEWTPSADIFEKGEDVLIRAELPGVKPEDVDITISDNILTMRGERENKEEIKQEDYYRSELFYGTFERSIVIPQGMKMEDVKATYNNGVLEIVLPKAAAKAEPKKVKVEVKAA